MKCKLLAPAALLRLLRCGIGYTITGLSPGTYKVTFSGYAWRVDSKPATIRANKTTTLIFRVSFMGVG
jgi:hypothetical protein